MASGAIRAKAKRAATFSLAEFSGSRLRARSMAFAMTLGSSLPKPELKRCVLCGDTRNLQGNYLGGRQHVAWLTKPFCAKCHSLFHAMVTGAEIDLSYTHDPIERFRREPAAIKIAEWMPLEELKNLNQPRRNGIMKSRNTKTESTLLLPPSISKTRGRRRY